ncbi:uncharacterized protein METZ01_LOCUS119418, partial [marine metagenome]
MAVAPLLEVPAILVHALKAARLDSMTTNDALLPKHASVISLSTRSTSYRQCTTRVCLG